MPDISFQTDQSGANSQICSASSAIFNFSVSSAYTASHAEFVMKRGSGSTGNVTVAIHNGANASGSVVASVSIPAASFSQTYTAMTFTFPANTNLTANSDYSLKISSASSCAGSAPYFIKAGSFQVLATGTLTVLSVGYGIAARPAAVATLSGTARATLGVRAALTAEAAVTSAAVCDFAAASALAAVTTLGAAASRLGANETNEFHHGASRIDGLYTGSTRVGKAYLGSTLVFDQPQ